MIDTDQQRAGLSSLTKPAANADGSVDLFFGPTVNLPSRNEPTFFGLPYGPANGLPKVAMGALTQALYDQAQKDGWTVVSMKNDWNRVFAFDEVG